MLVPNLSRTENRVTCFDRVSLKLNLNLLRPVRSDVEDVHDCVAPVHGRQNVVVKVHELLDLPHVDVKIVNIVFYGFSWGTLNVIRTPCGIIATINFKLNVP